MTRRPRRIVLSRGRKSPARAKRRTTGASPYHRCMSRQMKGIRGSQRKRNRAFANAVKICKRRAR